MRDDFQIRVMNLRPAAPAWRTALRIGTQVGEAAFRALYERTARSLLAYLLNVVRRRDVAEDLLQETYCRFLTVDIPPMDDREMTSYLFRIATNLMRDRWRRTAEGQPPETAAEAISPPPPFERGLAVRQALEKLKPRERQLLWLAYVEGFNHNEIAACTGLRAGSIRMLLFRARRRLAMMIGDTNRDGESGANTGVCK